jgi:hypothetical protein
VVAEPAASPPLSIVIATAEPWPEIRECLESVLDQARAVGAEVVVADGCGRALPDDPAFSDIVWLREIGSSVFRLRALGLSRSRGGVVAVTEDHCRAAPDWCERLLELHARYPQAAAIGGAVENGSTDSLIDWMNFLISNGPYMQPIARRKTRALTGQANVSFKRAILPSEAEEAGHVQMLFNRALRDRGLELIMDDRPVVWHIQSLGLAGTCALHFHNGRTIAGYRLPQLSAGGRLLRLGSCLILPGFLLARAMLTVIRKGRQRVRLALGLPFLVLLVSCHAVGEGVGYLRGPGSSPHRVR